MYRRHTSSLFLRASPSQRPALGTSAYSNAADGASWVFPVSVVENVVAPVVTGVKIDVIPTVETGVLVGCFIYWSAEGSISGVTKVTSDTDER